MKCYNCAIGEEITNDISNIDRIETELDVFDDEEEKYLLLCQNCVKLWVNGELDNIESKWISESNKIDYISIE